MMRPLIQKTCAFIAAAVLLSACQHTQMSNDAQHRVTVKDERTLGYFDVLGTHSEKPQESSQYVRKLYGQNAQKQWVLQDFYHPSNSPQTSVFALYDERGLYDWDSLQFSDGKVSFFESDGTKTSTIIMNKGTPVGKREYYLPNGRVYKTQTFDEQGEVLIESYVDEQNKVFFKFNHQTHESTFFDAKNKAYTNVEENIELYQQSIEKVLELEAQTGKY